MKSILNNIYTVSSPAEYAYIGNGILFIIYIIYNLFFLTIPLQSTIEITNKESQHLIKNAILPLDLKWKLDKCYGGGGSANIIVSWDHWGKV